jgi:hypothetical protein
MAPPLPPAPPALTPLPRPLLRRGRPAARLPLALALAALAALLAGGAAAWEMDRSTPYALPCECTDVDPRGSEFETAAVDADCWQQRIDGSCNKDFMFQTIKELPEGARQAGRHSACCRRPPPHPAASRRPRILGIAAASDPPLDTRAQNEPPPPPPRPQATAR